LVLIENQLVALGFRGMNTFSRKPKHVNALIKDRPQQELGINSIKSSIVVLRRWAQKADK
jgi:hypothetical protein